MGATSIVCPIEDESQVGTARRHGQRLAEQIGMDSTGRGKVGIVVTELATNVQRHAKRGTVVLRQVDEGGIRGIEALAIDRGGGIQDPERALQDGHSTFGSSGNGLGSVRRMSDEFDLFSEVGRGTVVLSRIHAVVASPRLPWRWGVVAANAPGEQVSGDGWAIDLAPNALAAVVADGLGHGPLAHAAAASAVNTFLEACDRPADQFFGLAHRRLRTTRGAAVATAHGDPTTDELLYAGIGNIGGVLASPDGRQQGLVSFNGTVGGEAHAVRENAYAFHVGDRLIMYTDGLQARWVVAERPGLMVRHPSVIAAVLFRDFCRGRDDCTVLVVERLQG